MDTSTEIAAGARPAGRRIPALWIAVMIAAGVLSACGDTTPTGPTTPVAGAPHIDSVSPAAITPQSSPITLTVTGSNFVGTFTVNVVGPDGSVTPFDQSALQALSATSFQLNMPFPLTGAWAITIVTAGGTASNLFALTVVQANAAPFILAANPTAVSVSSQPQTISMNGTNFIDGLSVRVTAPDGSLTILSGAALSLINPNQFQMDFVFTQFGIYSLTVMNPSGISSNTVTINVTR